MKSKFTKHLAIFRPDLAEAVLAGEKTIETRFSIHKIAPYGVISVGDLVFIKPSGREIIGQFRVKKVIFMEGLEANDVTEIFKRYKVEINSKLSAKFATIIFITESERLITSPIKIKKSDRRGWVVLD